MLLRTSVGGWRGASFLGCGGPDVNSNPVAGFHLNLLISTLEYLFPVTTFHSSVPLGWKDRGGPPRSTVSLRARPHTGSSSPLVLSQCHLWFKHIYGPVLSEAGLPSDSHSALGTRAGSPKQSNQGQAPQEQLNKYKPWHCGMARETCRVGFSD